MIPLMIWMLNSQIFYVMMMTHKTSKYVRRPQTVSLTLWVKLAENRCITVFGNYFVESYQYLLGIFNGILILLTSSMHCQGTKDETRDYAFDKAFWITFILVITWCCFLWLLVLLVIQFLSLCCFLLLRFVFAFYIKIVISCLLSKLCSSPGLYCNHYFLRLLAQVGRGHYDAAYKPGLCGSFFGLFLFSV